MLQRVRELAVQYKSGSLSSSDRTAIQSEVNQLASEIERIGGQSQFNSIKLLDNTNPITFQVGANDTDIIKINMVQLTAAVASGGVGTAYAALTTAASGATDLDEIDQ